MQKENFFFGRLCIHGLIFIYTRSFLDGFRLQSSNLSLYPSLSLSLSPLQKQGSGRINIQEISNLRTRENEGEREKKKKKKKD